MSVRAAEIQPRCPTALVALIGQRDLDTTPIFQLLPPYPHAAWLKFLTSVQNPGIKLSVDTTHVALDILSGWYTPAGTTNVVLVQPMFAPTIELSSNNKITLQISYTSSVASYCRRKADVISGYCSQ